VCLGIQASLRPAHKLIAEETGLLRLGRALRRCGRRLRCGGCLHRGARGALHPNASGATGNVVVRPPLRGPHRAAVHGLHAASVRRSRGPGRDTRAARAGGGCRLRTGRGTARLRRGGRRGCRRRLGGRGGRLCRSGRGRRGVGATGQGVLNCGLDVAIRCDHRQRKLKDGCNKQRIPYAWERSQNMTPPKDEYVALSVVAIVASVEAST
jgi:hypothetical protein